MGFEYHGAYSIREQRIAQENIYLRPWSVDGEQFPQVGGEFDEVGFYDALGDEVDHGQQQERFVRGAVFGCSRPARATGVGAEGGEGFGGEVEPIFPFYTPAPQHPGIVVLLDGQPVGSSRGKVVSRR